MQRWIPILALTLVLQLALAVVLRFTGNPLAAQQPNAPFLQGNPKAADSLVVAGPEATSVAVVRKGGRWILPDAAEAPASQVLVQSLLDKLAEARRGFPVATTASARKRFKVEEDNFERRLTLKEGGQELATVYLGSSPGLRKVHARLAGDEAIYAIALATYDLPLKADEWLDRSLLERDRETLTALHLEGGLVLRRFQAEGEPPWRAEGLAPGETLNLQAVGDLANRLSRMQVDGVLGTEASPEWGQVRPLLTLQMENAKGERETWNLSKPESGEFYVFKSTAQNWFFKLQDANATSLLEAAGRSKLVMAAPASPGPEPAAGASTTPPSQAGEAAPEPPKETRAVGEPPEAGEAAPGLPPDVEAPEPPKEAEAVGELPEAGEAAAEPPKETGAVGEPPVTPEETARETELVPAEE
jgi:hypothetical protein